MVSWARFFFLAALESRICFTSNRGPCKKINKPHPWLGGSRKGGGACCGRESVQEEVSICRSKDSQVEGDHNQLTYDVHRPLYATPPKDKDRRQGTRG